jgi:hypothetical protein
VLRKEIGDSTTEDRDRVAHDQDLGTVEEGEDACGKNRVQRGYTVPRR